MFQGTPKPEHITIDPVTWFLSKKPYFLHPEQGRFESKSFVLDEPLHDLDSLYLLESGNFYTPFKSNTPRSDLDNPTKIGTLAKVWEVAVCSAGQGFVAIPPPIKVVEIVLSTVAADEIIVIECNENNIELTTGGMNIQGIHFGVKNGDTFDVLSTELQGIYSGKFLNCRYCSG